MNQREPPPTDDAASALPEAWAPDAPERSILRSVIEGINRMEPITLDELPAQTRLDRTSVDVAVGRLREDGYLAGLDKMAGSSDSPPRSRHAPTKELQRP